jgi:DivIVA domain-containing protein
MDSTDTTRSALDQIKKVSFKTGLRGYVVDEVDDFLDQAAIEVDELREQLHQLRQQLRQASERIVQLQNGAPAPTPISVLTPAPAPAPAPLRAVADGSEQVASMIAMAHQFIEQAQTEAEAKARDLTTTAQERAREIINEARSRAEDEVQRLNGLKQRLSEDVDALTRQLTQERARVKKVLGDLHQWIEDSMHVSVNTPRPSSPDTTQSSESRPSAAAPAPITDIRPVSPPPAPSATIGDMMGTLSEDNPR